MTNSIWGEGSESHAANFKEGWNSIPGGKGDLHVFGQDRRRRDPVHDERTRGRKGERGTRCRGESCIRGEPKENRWRLVSGALKWGKGNEFR